MVYPKWFVKKQNLYLYSSHFLSAWGDHMWMFGSGLLLIEILPESLQLTAIYGLSVGLSVLLFGTLVGDWVDRTPRFRAVQTALILQKSFIVLSVTTVCGYMWYRDSSTETMEDWKRHLSYGFIIAFAVLGQLAQVARVITIERDWVVEMCKGDTDMLASVTATMRRIDLGTMVLAPIVTGQIMTYIGLKYGAVFIGGWNGISVFFGYFLMWKVYHTVPSLQKLKKATSCSNGLTLKEEEANRTPGDQAHELISECPPEEIAKPKQHAGDDVSKESNPLQTFCRRTTYSMTTLYRGMKTYKKYDVYRAGFSLACLYFTVLGFDGITVGYMYTQGISESMLGILMGAAAAVGIIGTVAYPIIRRRVGLIRTGLFALGSQWVFIALCVMSVFLPGSPFDPQYWTRTRPLLVNSSCVNQNDSTVPVELASTNVTLLSANASTSGFDSPCGELQHLTSSMISICVFVTGIIGARFGVWTADLTITQLFLENVVESERGVVNGVQTSINMLMEMLKFALVVGLPHPQVFGFLAIISFCCVTTGDVVYALFSRKKRGHLFHFMDCGKHTHDPVLEVKVTEY